LAKASAGLCIRFSFLGSAAFAIYQHALVMWMWMLWQFGLICLDDPDPPLEISIPSTGDQAQASNFSLNHFLELEQGTLEANMHHLNGAGYLN